MSKLRPIELKRSYTEAYVLFSDYKSISFSIKAVTTTKNVNICINVQVIHGQDPFNVENRVHDIAHCQLASHKLRNSELQEGNHPAVVLCHPRMMSWNLSGKAECVPPVRAALSPGSKPLLSV